MKYWGINLFNDSPRLFSSITFLGNIESYNNPSNKLLELKVLYLYEMSSKLNVLNVNKPLKMTGILDEILILKIKGNKELIIKFRWIIY